MTPLDLEVASEADPEEIPEAPSEETLQAGAAEALLRRGPEGIQEGEAVGLQVWEGRGVAKGFVGTSRRANVLREIHVILNMKAETRWSQLLKCIQSQRSRNKSLCLIDWSSRNWMWSIDLKAIRKRNRKFRTLLKKNMKMEKASLIFKTLQNYPMNQKHQNKFLHWRKRKRLQNLHLEKNLEWRNQSLDSSSLYQCK